jgi:hypothetical protein
VLVALTAINVAICLVCVCVAAAIVIRDRRKKRPPTSFEAAGQALVEPARRFLELAKPGSTLVVTADSNQCMVEIFGPNSPDTPPKRSHLRPVEWH